METFLNRYRNLTVLLVVIAAQLLLLAWQVKSSPDVRLLRVWSVSTVTAVTEGLEFVRRNTIGLVGDYFVLVGVHNENQRLRDEIGKLKMRTHLLTTELSTADRVRALAVFQSQTPSRTIAARIIGNGTAANSAEVFVDRGASADVEKGMAVVTPDGIVGRVVEAYPMASLVLLATDPSFGAGVVSQKNRVHGTLKGAGHGLCTVEYVQNEQKVDVGEWFYTSGYDRVFPRGFPVGQASVVRNGRFGKEIFISPNGFQGGLDEVLIVIEGVHQRVPEQSTASSGIHLTPLPPSDEAAAGAASVNALPGNTEADRIKAAYKRIGDAQNHVFGEGTPGSKPPDFNLKVTGNPAPAKPAAAPESPPVAPGEQLDDEVHNVQPDYSAGEAQKTPAAKPSSAKQRPTRP